MLAPTKIVRWVWREPSCEVTDRYIASTWCGVEDSKVLLSSPSLLSCLSDIAGDETRGLASKVVLCWCHSAGSLVFHLLLIKELGTMAAAGWLDVTIIGARDLKDTEIFGMQDPYAVLIYGQQTHRTKTHKDGHTSPVWNTTFRLNVIHGVDEAQLAVWNENRKADDKIGTCKQQGSLRLALKYYPVLSVTFCDPSLACLPLPLPPFRHPSQPLGAPGAPAAAAAAGAAAASHSAQPPHGYPQQHAPPPGGHAPPPGGHAPPPSGYPGYPAQGGYPGAAPAPYGAPPPGGHVPAPYGAPPHGGQPPAPYGAPPQGYPPAGHAPAPYGAPPPHGYPPQGYPPQGYPGYGAPPPAHGHAPPHVHHAPKPAVVVVHGHGELGGVSLVHMGRAEVKGWGQRGRAGGRGEGLGERGRARGRGEGLGAEVKDLGSLSLFRHHHHHKRKFKGFIGKRKGFFGKRKGFLGKRKGFFGGKGFF
ncbi:unnamed protein product [Closterium sp. NIES-65]|nr:unnamed protein product [Closterium sp. NIES-65]